VIAARPSIDDRYAVGYCPCTPQPVSSDPKTPPRERPTVHLVREDIWRPEILDKRREADRRRRLLRRRAAGTLRETEKAAADEAFAQLWERTP